MSKKILMSIIFATSVLSLLVSLAVAAKTKTTDYLVISAGGTHSLGVKSDGTLWHGVGILKASLAWVILQTDSNRHSSGLL